VKQLILYLENIREWTCWSDHHDGKLAWGVDLDRPEGYVMIQDPQLRRKGNHVWQRFNVSEPFPILPIDTEYLEAFFYHYLDDLAEVPGFMP
jgi:hypothetical protein